MWVIRVALTLSVCLKNFLLFFIPFLIFSGTALAFSQFSRGGIGFVFGLLVIVSVSNFCNLMFSGLVGYTLIPVLAPPAGGHALAGGMEIDPYFAWTLRPLLSNTAALVGGVTFGVGCAFFPSPVWARWIRRGHRGTMWIMTRCFVPILPLFLGGFLLKLLREDRLSDFVRGNAVACLIMVTFLCLYLSLWLVMAAMLSGKRAGEIIRNIFPPMMAGASTMSSAAALPFSIEAATQNTGDPILAQAVMPLTLNFHMVGDTICIPIMSLIILNTFQMPVPDLVGFILFGTLYVLNKFAGAGIPGGTVMVSLPILHRYLGFNEEMLALITAFYMIVDPIITAGNVTANNLLVVFIKKMLRIKTTTASEMGSLGNENGMENSD
jgi:Na+/H+-dicarboxylate symporter